MLSLTRRKANVKEKREGESWSVEKEKRKEERKVYKRTGGWVCAYI